MAHLELDKLTKIYNEDSGESVTAVDELDIQLEEGEFLVLVGPSGCGKSTTLRSIAGLEDLTSGEIRIDSTVVNDMPPAQRDIAMVFQDYALYPHMTARENMSFGLRMTTDLNSSEIKERVDEAAETMGITELLDDRPGELSGGQQQRVALGRSIVRQPEVFLLDEPLSNLDAKLRGHMRTEIQQLQQELGVTTVYVTHDQTEAMTMGDKIAILNYGELQQIGTPLECYNEPANVFVAEFIGEPAMNTFPLTCEDEELRSDTMTYPVPARASDEVKHGDEITLGIRPRDVELADEDGPDTVTGDILVVEPMGDSLQLTVDINGTEATVSVDAEFRLQSGDTIRLRFPTEGVHLFDTVSGEAIANRTISESDPSNAILSAT
jgi:multiple sugar transport system ATP-binding protein